MRLPSLNPFWMCSYSFICVLILYSLHLSEMYGSFGIITILVVFFISVFFIIGAIFNVKLKAWFHNNKKEKSEPLIWFNVCFVVIGFFIDCLPSFHIPLLSIMHGDQYSYTEFGLKTFHVFYMGYISAFAVVSFEHYLKNKKLSCFLGFTLPIVVTLLIVNRGALLLIIFPMVFVYMYQRKASNSLNINFKVFSFILVLVGIVAFGYIGDKRMISSGYTNEKAILDIGQADPVFENIPTGFFWVYLYASSPIANLIEQERVGNINRGDFFDFVAGSISPDFISKYTNPNISKSFEFDKITPELTVSTGFGRAVVIYGYMGFILLVCWMLLLILTFSWLNRQFHIRSVCAILSSISALMIFDNMFIFSSCIMQLILITILSRFKIGLRSLL
ncbi:oligosaccharide repeat unit polymerase [Scandinavium sp. H11S7]|uniref:O-antigen polymerase n=1 Tax=Scandinavium hiltneri TaxID=2926519 RepID=UPI0021652B19|nr:O-antigen polymerase [Scandinavium hiltneri]MCS2156065.1 oligosaccharide repeat unit polymerase [Scandinavium hiltneri]